MSSSPIAFIFAQATNAVSAAGNATGVSPDAVAPAGPPVWTNFIFFALILSMVYFALIRPQVQAKKKTEETIKSAKTGDKIVTTGGIHGVITNVKDTTVIVKIADNVKIEIEKAHIDKITRADSAAASDKTAPAKP